MASVTRTYFMFTVADMTRAVSFYRDVLGPVVRTESETWSEIKLGDATVALHLVDELARKQSGLAVEVDDLTATYHAVTAFGGQVLAGPHTDALGHLSYEVADTEGNTFVIVGAAPFAPPATADTPTPT